MKLLQTIILLVIVITASSCLKRKSWTCACETTDQNGNLVTSNSYDNTTKNPDREISCDEYEMSGNGYKTECEIE